ncbi:hypothetical protein ABZZ04_23825 [Streptomyces sp. NPDC006435]|uniref:hypothetical protein n=1 Tax=Streptomyces sp. NPDC006435 TaxID=3154300 RepID=UPI0033AF2FC0
MKKAKAAACELFWARTGPALEGGGPSRPEVMALANGAARSFQECASALTWHRHVG